MRKHHLTVLLTMVILTHAFAAETKHPTPKTTEHPGTENAAISSPLTYPDEAGFNQRVQIILAGLAENDLTKWRRGYFAGGDPGKYLPGHAMAKLLTGQDDPHIVKLFNDERSVREHYHFAAMNWGRFLPLFGNDILTAEKRRELAERAGNYDAYLQGGGTENHVTQWRTAANVLPHFIEGDRFAKRDKESALREAKQWLHNYIKGIYTAGNGEWDSSTYIMFTINGLLNIYDFSPDEETRLLARAGLDWFASAYALKYRDGIFTAPNQRGFAAGAHKTISDQTGYLWWGSNASITTNDTRDWRYTLAPITSGWRPNTVICNLAQKKLPLLDEAPQEFRNSKPNYWGTTGTPTPSRMHESVYISKSFTIGTLWNGHGSQITRFMIAAESPSGGKSITGGNPRKSDHTGKKTGLGFHDGNSRYTQFAADHNTVISMSLAPEDDTEAHYSYVSLPEDYEIKMINGWQCFNLGKAVIAVHPLGNAETELTATEPDKHGNTTPIIKIKGQRSGFVIKAFEQKDDIVARLNDEKILEDNFSKAMSVTALTANGKLTMKFNPDEENDRHANRTADASINGAELEFGNWPVYDGKLIKQANGILTVNDGNQGFTIDFSGDMPVYSELQ